MTALSGNDKTSVGKQSFWKANAKSLPGSIKQVYGAQHPPRHEKIESPSKKVQKAHSKDAFEYYQEKTDDAWDCADDDLIEMNNFRISLKDVRSTALQVIRNHSQQRLSEQANEYHSQNSLSSKPPGSENFHRGTVNGVSDLMCVNGETMSTQDPQYSSSSSNNSAPSTPSHLPTHRIGGPGLGVRLESKWGSVKLSPYSQISTPDRELLRLDKFKSMLQSPNVNLEELRKLSWSGIPSQYRATTWKLLSGYLPLIAERREAMLDRKRQEYHNFVDQYYSTRLQDIHQDTYRQIHIDIPRMSPLIPLFQQTLVQEIFERILYIWAIRHPASGYVQGINDLVTPIFVVFLTEFIDASADVENYPVSKIEEPGLDRLEADSFWCFSKLLDGIQDNYTFAQPGIQKRVNLLKELITRIDNNLHRHLEKHHVEYLQFSFRWMNNLLMREMPLHCVIRIWDTYLSESDGFALFHMYVCAALLTKFSEELQRETDFQGLMLLLQNLPTRDWTSEDIGLLLADAYRLKFMFADAPKHLRDSQS